MKFLAASFAFFGRDCKLFLVKRCTSILFDLVRPCSSSAMCAPKILDCALSSCPTNRHLDCARPLQEIQRRNEQRRKNEVVGTASLRPMSRGGRWLKFILCFLFLQKLAEEPETSPPRDTAQSRRLQRVDALMERETGEVRGRLRNGGWRGKATHCSVQAALKLALIIAGDLRRP